MPKSHWSNRGRSLLIFLILGFGLVDPRSKPEVTHPSESAAASRPSAPSVSSWKLPIYFEANVGQFPAAVRYEAHGLGYGVSLKASEVDVTWSSRPSGAGRPERGSRGRAAVQSTTLRTSFPGSNRAAPLRGLVESLGKIRYFQAGPINDLEIPTYERVVYDDLYPGIDLVYYESQGKLEYDFVVAAGAHPEQIRLQYDTQPRLPLNPRVDPGGDLVLELGSDEVRFQKPRIYQEIEGGRQSVEGGFQILEGGETGFWLGSYDPTRALVIDPSLLVSLLLGNDRGDEGNGIAVDAAGKIYVAGSTSRPATAPDDGLRAFMAILNPDGSFVRAIQAGVSSLSSDVAVDRDGLIYLAGNSIRGDEIGAAFPGACLTTARRGFLVRVAPTGVSQFATCLPAGPEASNFSFATDVAVDAQGSMYVSGNRNGEPFASKITRSGTVDHYLHLAQSGEMTGVGFDSQGATYVTGDTSVTADKPNLLPAVNPLFPCKTGARNVFVMKVKPGGSGLDYSTCIGTGDAHDLAVDSEGAAYVVGSTSATDFPVKDALQGQSAGFFDVFVFKIGSDGKLAYSTYLGGSGSDRGHSIAVDGEKNASLVGTTGRSGPPEVLFPQLNPIQASHGGGLDAFVSKLSAAGDRLLFSTFLGGGSQDDGLGVAVDGAGLIYVTGLTESADFPKQGPSQALSGGKDLFVSKIDPGGGPPQARIGLNPASLRLDAIVGKDNPAARNVALTNTGGGTMNWQAATRTVSGGNWLRVSPASGSLAAGQSVTLEASVDARALFSDLYSGAISVSSADAVNSAQEVRVELLVGCPAESVPLGAAREAASCNDILRLDDIAGFRGAISEAGLKSSGIKILVTYGMLSHKSAKLFLRLYDQDGNQVGSSEETSITRPDPVPDPPPPAVDKLLEIPGSAIHLLPTSLRLEMYAVFIDPANGNEFKLSNEVVYYLGTLNIDAESTQTRSTLTENGQIDVGYAVKLTRVWAGKRDTNLRDKLFDGTVHVSLGASSTKGIAQLGSPSRDGGNNAPIPVKLVQGESEFLDIFFFTPEDNLFPGAIITPKTVLEGTLVIRAETGQIPGLAFGLDTELAVRVRNRLDLRIDRIEFQQGVAEDRSGPRVRFRDSLVRVFINADRNEFSSYGSIEGIAVKLTARDEAAKEIIGSPFTLTLGAFANSPVPTEPYVFRPQGADSLRGGDSLNLVISGIHERLSLEAELVDVYPDLDRFNNVARLGPLHFAPSRLTTILYSKVRTDIKDLSIEPPGNDFPTPAGIEMEKEFCQLVYPVSAGRLRFIEQNPQGEVTDYPFRTLQWVFWLNRGWGQSNVKGWVFFCGGNYFGLTRLGANKAGQTDRDVALVNSDFCRADRNRCGALAHEIGHIFGLGDTYIDEGAHPSPVNPRRDDATRFGNLVESGHFNSFLHRFAVGGLTFLDFMGNGILPLVPQPVWTDRTTWTYLKSQLGVTSSQTVENAAEQGIGTFVFVQGQVLKSGGARFGNSYTRTAADLATPSAGGSYQLETLDANSAVLHTVSFEPSFRVPHTDQDLAEVGFGYALPFSETVRQIRLRLNSNVLAVRPVSARPPTLRFETDFGGATLTGARTVSWSGADPDGDALSYSLFYSPDGQLRIPLILETDKTSYSWNTEDSPSGPSPMLTLVATDGVRAALVDSRPFNLPNRAPRITILTPKDASQFGAGDAVELEGSFDDPEEGLDLNPKLAWTSDIQGVLGTGKRIVARNLAVGTHRITAAGTDGQGARGTAAITVRVVVATIAGCDVNGDGQVNIVDTQLLINRVFAASALGDINCDGRTDILDIQTSINVILGIISCPSCTAPTTTLAPSTTTTSIATTTTTVRPTTTTSSTTTVRLTTTTSTTSTTTTVRPTTTTTTTRPTTTTTLPAAACGLFRDDFSDAGLPGWFTANATWSVVNGKLQVSRVVDSSRAATASHTLPFPNFFRLTMDVEIAGFNGGFYGFEPYSNSARQTFIINGRITDGLGAGWVPNVGAVFLGFDLVQEEFFHIAPANPILDPIASLGVQWTSTAVTLLVNGTARATLPASSFGLASIPLPQFEAMDLLVTGSTTQIRFDNICMSAPAALSGDIRQETIRLPGAFKLDNHVVK